jgi:sugar phosphate permease
MREDRWLRVILVAFVMYTISFIDRTNIALALPAMSRDLGMNPVQAGGAAGAFFWGYLVLQIPGGYLAGRWSAKSFVSILLVAWGACAVGTGLVATWREFWAMRLLLGVAEGGVWPATLVLLAHWFPRAERARANAFWMLCLPVAVVISSPLSGWILGRWNWRVLLVAEGLLPLVWLLVWAARISDHPRHARWISAEERQYLEDTLARETRELEQSESAARAAVPDSARASEPLWRALARPPVLLMVAIYFLVNAGNYGYLFWLPTGLEKAKQFSHLTVGLLFAVPYVLTGISMVLISRHSDRQGERRHHVAVALVWSGLMLLGGVLANSYSPLASFALIALVGAGSYGLLGPFWAIPTETLSSRVAGPAMGLINAVGNLGGYYGPLAVGYLNQRTGNLVAAFALLGLGLLAGAGLTLLLPASPSSH